MANWNTEAAAVSTALAAGLDREVGGNYTQEPFTAGGTIYRGGLVCINGAGVAVAAANTANFVCVGYALNYATSGQVVTVAMQGIIRKLRWHHSNSRSLLASRVGDKFFAKTDAAGVGKSLSSAVFVGVIIAVDTTALTCDVLHMLSGAGTGTVAGVHG